MPRAVPPHAAPGRSASLEDVAALASVSTSTVSRALSRPGMVNEATLRRVRLAADRLGYVANGAARALAMRRTLTVGAIVPRFGTSSFPTLVQALESTLAAQGYTLLLSAPAHGQQQEPAILRALLERGVDAVALMGIEQPPPMFAMLQAARTPFVLMWAPPGAARHTVGFDEEAAAARLVAHLAELGHRTVGFIGGRMHDNERARRRFHGLVRAIAQQDMRLSEAAHIETDYGFAEGFEAMQRILALRPGPSDRVTAVVCGNDYLAAGALSALARAGIDVPRTLSVASFNDNDFAPYLHPPLTTVRLPIREIGETAGRYLLQCMGGAADPPEPPALPVELMVRESTGPARA